MVSWTIRGVIVWRLQRKVPTPPSSERSTTSYPSGRQYTLAESRFMKTWCVASRLCVYACVLGPRPWKYLPHTRHAYTLKLLPLIEHAFSKSALARAVPRCCGRARREEEERRAAGARAHQSRAQSD